MKMRVWCVGVVLLAMACTVCAQGSKQVSDLESRRNEVRQRIAESEDMLRSNKKDVKSQLGNLALLDGQIANRKAYIDTIAADLKIIDANLAKMGRELEGLERDLAEKKSHYAASVKYMYRNRTVQDKLMFIFSADNLMKMYRRLRYVRQYGNFQYIQAQEIQRKRTLIAEKRKELEASKLQQERLLRENESARAKLEKQEKDRKAVLAKLQRQQKNLKNEIARQRRVAQQLDRRIEQLIAAEIKAQQEAERKRKKEKDKEQSSQSSQSETTSSRKEKKKAGGERRSDNEEGEVRVKSKKKMDEYRLSSSERKLSGTFEQNRGRLPMPISGPYVITSYYGRNKVANNKYVMLNNSGIDIRGKEGAKACAVFDGVVSGVFQLNGMNHVFVRHGHYITFYCNLASLSVRKGDRVKTRQVLGTIAKDPSGSPILHFELRREVAKINPMRWLAR